MNKKEKRGRAQSKKLPKGYKLLGVLLLCILVICIAVAVKNSTDKEEDTYREVIVEYGSLVVGVEENGTVDIGTVDQVFELDMSALKRVETTNTGSSGTGSGGSFDGISSSGGAGFGGTGGGGFSGAPAAGGTSSGSGQGASSGSSGMFNQMFNMGGSNTTSQGEDSQLEIAEVLVAVGEEVEVGDVLYVLVEEGITELTDELSSNVSKAKADLDALIADQELSKATAENTYNTSIAYGTYAEVEKTSTLRSLQKAVTEAQEAVMTAKENISKYEAKLVQAEYDLGLAKEVLDSSIWQRDNTKDGIIAVSSAYLQADEAQSTYDTLEKERDQAESNLEQAKKTLESSEASLAKAQRVLESGKVSAEETYALRVLAYDNAKETYDITFAYLSDDLKAQEEIYMEAEEKWNEFSSHVSGTQIVAKYNGVITEVGLAAGDFLTTGASVITLYDMDEVSMTVSVEEEDMTHIEVGGLANISFTAYPDEVFKAEISDISDASGDNSGTTTYDVTVTIKGDVSGLFQGMTGDITFITKETAEVLYVSNRAIIREGTKSYVKVKDAKGNVKKTEVSTGFSDGVNVEIKEGLQEGDIVLIESKVNQK